MISSDTSKDNKKNSNSDNFKFLLRSSYHQKALQQIRNSLQPFATPEYPTFSSNSSVSNSPRASPNFVPSEDGGREKKSSRGIEYRAREYPFVPSQVPPSVQKLLQRMDSPTINSTTTSPTPSSTTSPSPSTPPPHPLPTTQPHPTLLIKSTAVLKPILQNATNPNNNNNNPPPPPLPPKKDRAPPLPPKTPIETIQHSSPIPERKKLTKEMEMDRMESKVRLYSPQAFKFFMEQHVENVIKSHQERLHRRMQLESEMAKIGLSDEAQTQMRRMLSQKESNYIRLKRAKMSVSMFKPIRTIGVGAFGEVALVQKLDSQPRSLYAMKTLRKSDVLRRNQVAHVKAERDILAEADNEWVVKLYYSFQDLENLYFVMDYIPGGDLMSLLIKRGIFEEELARFYIAELTIAVESVHRMGFIHRDIKPDNILIDRDGHIKLTDFGLCTGFRWTHNSKYYLDCDCDSSPCECLKKVNLPSRNKSPRTLAHSLVGTPNYIAPEVLLRSGYTQLCDWWSVGVILYEMLVGQPPFLAPSPAETQYKVVNFERSLKIPGGMLGKEARDLVLGLLRAQETRLGGGDLKAHPFFTPLQSQLSNLRRCPAPYIPVIAHPTDTSNFDPCDVQDYKEEELLMDNQFHGFYEFTFRRFFDDSFSDCGSGGGQGPVYV